MSKVCPVCRQPPQDALLVRCDRCKVPFEDEISLRLPLSHQELAQVANYILKSWRFWVPLSFGLLVLTWSLLQVLDYSTGRKVQHVIDAISADVNNRLDTAHVYMVNEIARRFESPNVQILMEEVVTREATARIDATADKVIALRIQSEIAPRLEQTEIVLANAGKALSRLESLSEFYELAIRLKSDDRKAFDDIMKILRTPSDSRYAQVQALVVNLPKEVEVLNLLEYSVDWDGIGINPNTADIRAFKDAMGKLRPIHQTKLMETVWKTERLTKFDRVDFLMDIALHTPSLRCLDKACRYLNDESKLNRNFLFWQDYLTWWEFHKDQYKKTEQDESIAPSKATHAPHNIR